MNLEQLEIKYSAVSLDVHSAHSTNAHLNMSFQSGFKCG